jgi:hypothetical protein
VSPQLATFLLVTGANIACVVWSVHAAYRHIVAERQALKAADLLRELCVQAYFSQHQPIWQAWADCMGSIKVRASFVRDEIDGEAP